MAKATTPQDDSAPYDYADVVAEGLDATPVDEAQESSQDLVKPTFQSGDLRGIQSFDDAMSLMLSAGITIDDATEAIGDGFALLDTKEKKRLCGIPLLFMTWTFNPGEFGEFVAARVVAKLDNGTVGKYVIIDGSEGIYKQLKEYTAEFSKLGGLATMGGLNESNYETMVEGKMTPATTYYIDVSTK